MHMYIYIYIHISILVGAHMLWSYFLGMYDGAFCYLMTSTVCIISIILKNFLSSTMQPKEFNQTE